MNKLTHKISSVGTLINDNKYFIGFTMILLNIGARFIIDELDDDLRQIASDKIVRKLFIFCSFFMATKDIFTALILTIVFIVLVNEFLVTEGEEEEEKEKEAKTSKKGESFNKKELEKTIQQLKVIQAQM